MNNMPPQKTKSWEERFDEYYIKPHLGTKFGEAWKKDAENIKKFISQVEQEARQCEREEMLKEIQHILELYRVNDL